MKKIDKDLKYFKKAKGTNLNLWKTFESVQYELQIESVRGWAYQTFLVTAKC